LKYRKYVIAPQTLTCGKISRSQRCAAKKRIFCRISAVRGLEIQKVCHRPANVDLRQNLTLFLLRCCLLKNAEKAHFNRAKRCVFRRKAAAADKFSETPKKSGGFYEKYSKPP